MKFLRFTGLSDENLLTLIIVHLYGHAILGGESIPNGGPSQIYPCLVQVLLNAVQYVLKQQTFFRFDDIKRGNFPPPGRNNVWLPSKLCWVVRETFYSAREGNLRAVYQPPQAGYVKPKVGCSYFMVPFFSV